MFPQQRLETNGNGNRTNILNFSHFTFKFL